MSEKKQKGNSPKEQKMTKRVRAGYYYKHQFGYTLCDCQQVSADLRKGDFVIEQNDGYVCGEVVRIWQKKDGRYTIIVK